MRTMIFVLVAFITGCNGSSDDDSLLATKAQLPPNESTQVQALQAEVDALKKGQSELALIGKLKSNLPVDSVGRVLDATGTPVSFGPCSNMGLFQGRGGSDSQDPLLSQVEIYKTTGCNGINGVFTSYNDLTGLHDVPPFIAWDGPNCQGNVYIETDVPQNAYAQSVLDSGIVFTNPVDSLAYWLKGGQTPVPIQIQSSLNTRPGSAGCNSDIETRMAVLAIRNDVTQSGVPDSLVPGSWTNGSP